MKFIFDHNLPPSLARAIQALCEKEIVVEHLTDRFPATITDKELIENLAKDGNWVIITQDLYRGIHEKEALRASNLIVFFLAKGWSEVKFWQKAYQLVRWWPIIMEQAERIKGGAVFKIPYQFSGKGKFEQFKL